MGIAKSAVSVRLNGSREFSISELVEIAAWLDISLADLLGPESVSYTHLTLPTTPYV